MISITFLSLCIIVLVSSQIDPLCSFLSATSVGKVTTSWNCTKSGVVIGEPCGVNPWEGLQCSNVGGVVTSIAFTGSLTGICY